MHGNASCSLLECCVLIRFDLTLLNCGSSYLQDAVVPTSKCTTTTTKTATGGWNSSRAFDEEKKGFFSQLLTSY